MKNFVSAIILIILASALYGCASSVTSHEERTRILDSKNTLSIY